MTPEQARQRFGFLLDALKFGAPPHGGIALGLDRLTMMLAGTTQHPRRDRLPEEPEGPRPDDRGAGAGGCEAAEGAGVVMSCERTRCAEAFASCWTACCEASLNWMSAVSQKTWGGRFSGETDNRVEAFTESISFDRRLYRHDILASQAHARMLAEVGLLTADEAEQIVAALDDIAGRDRTRRVRLLHQARRHPHPHRTGPDRAAGRRRPQAAHRPQPQRSGRHRRQALGARRHRRHRRPAARAASAPCSTRPSATATWSCPATRTCSGPSRCWRPITSWPTSRNTSATASAWPTAASASTSCRSAPPPWPARRCPSTATACAGSSASTRVAANSLDVSSDRDFVLEFVFDLSVIALHLSGWAEEWILWATTEFGFLDLPDAFCTGSSIMPHKKNPDVLELIRGKTARVVGRLAAVADAGEGAAAGLQSRFAGGQAGPVRRPRHRGRLAGAGRRPGARDALPHGGRSPPGWKTASWTRRR